MKNRKAQTLFEVVLTLVIISIVIIVTLIIQKPFDKKLGLFYHSAFTTVATAAFNINLDLASGASFPATPSALCEALAGDQDGYINASYVNCNDNAVSLAADSFPANAIQFTTNNGMNVYISDIQTIPVTFNSIAYPDIVMRVVFVDLNGESPPNTAESTSSQMADIVGFVVTDDGDTVIIGQPEIDPRYILARVAYPDTTGETDFVYSKSMPYYAAKILAWGDVFHPDEIKSFDFKAELPEGSKLKITYPATPVYAVNESSGCVENSATAFSPCEVSFDDYYR